MLRVVILFASYSLAAMDMARPVSEEIFQGDEAHCTLAELKKQSDCVLAKKVSGCFKQCPFETTNDLAGCLTKCVASVCHISETCALCFGNSCGRSYGCLQTGACLADDLGASCQSCVFEVGYEQQKCMKGPELSFAEFAKERHQKDPQLALALSAAATEHNLGDNVHENMYGKKCSPEDEQTLQTNLFGITEEFFACYSKACPDDDVDCVRSCVSTNCKLREPCAGCYAFFEEAKSKCNAGDCKTDPLSDKCNKCEFRASMSFAKCTHGLHMPAHKEAMVLEKTAV